MLEIVLCFLLLMVYFHVYIILDMLQWFFSQTYVYSLAERLFPVMADIVHCQFAILWAGICVNLFRIMQFSQNISLLHAVSASPVLSLDLNFSLMTFQSLWKKVIIQKKSHVVFRKLSNQSRVLSLVWRLHYLIWRHASEQLY